ncbi:MAG: SusC/RagA family TonB-linked outer membrane protein [Bacteroidota bacterium]
MKKIPDMGKRDWHVLNKIFQTMCITLFLLLLGMGQLFAEGSYDQNMKLNTDFNNVQTETNFQQDERVVSGKVVDQDGNPVPGVSITVKNTTRGTITNEDGEYSLENVGTGDVLVFSFIGMKDQEVEVEDQSRINITMEEEVEGLDEVVIVGYGSQERQSVVGSISSIEPNKLQSQSSRALSNNLAGKLSGVLAVQRSGEPGYDGSQFWIRGISTFAGDRSPLVLVDGVERTLDDIDPAEIESFSILKDASASAVYGVRGANGVILVNTKRGEVGAPSIEVRYEKSFTQPVKLPDFLGAPDYLELLNSIAEEEGKSSMPYEQDRIDKIRSGYDKDLYPDVNWLDEITRNYGTSDHFNLTASGGTEMLRYAIVGSYFGEEGILGRDTRKEWDSSVGLDKYNLRSNVDLDLTPTTLLRVNIGGYLQDRNGPPQSIDYLFSTAMETPPHVHPPQYSNGEIPVVPERVNPWALATQTGYESNSASKIESLFEVTQDLDFILPGLETNFKFSFDRYSANSVARSKEPEYYLPATGRNERGELETSVYRYGQEFLDYSTDSEWGNRSTYIEGSLVYSQNFGEHYIDGLLLYNKRHNDIGDRLPYRDQGLAGRASYSFARKYIAEFNFGYNGSENFAKGNRFGFFPSVALGWVMSEEEFMSSLSSTFSNIKFRLSHGLVGNDDIGGRRFAYITTIGDTDGYTWGVDNDYSRAGRWEGDYGVPNLTWETVAKTNIGVELGLWNAVDLQVDLFKEQRRDIFMQRQTIPASSGFVNTPWANYGKVDNEGIDIVLDVNQQITNDLSVSARGTFTYAENEIIEQDEPATVVGTHRSSTGHSVGQFFGLVSDGLFTEDDFSNVEEGTLASEVPSHTYGPVRPGDIKYKDINEDGVINDLDRTAIGGTEDPKIVYGFGANLQYKDLDFGFFLQGNAETYRMIGDGTSYFIPGSGGGALGNFYSNVDDRWTVDDPQQDVFWPRLADYVHSNNTQQSDWWLRDMSMLRVKNVELGYSLPEQLISRAAMKSARLFVRGDNIMTFSDFDLWDPEGGTNTGFRYPIMKSISFGANIRF